MTTRITDLFSIQHPIIQGGMVWNSGWELASAVSNAGALGVLGAGSMYPDVLRHHIDRCLAHTDKPFGVNLPLLYPDIEEHIKTIIEKRIPIVFTSAGNPKTWTSLLQKEGIIVVHVVSSVRFAQKCEEVGVDAIVAEGFEAGGHNGREETTTFCLLPDVKKHITIPLIAAGGIATGKQMLAAEILGAEGFQLGSRFAASEEASSHHNFKQEIVKAKEGDTTLTLKEVTPVRLIKNSFYAQVQKAYEEGATVEQLTTLLGKGRAKKGMFEGDLEEGELEIGQVSSLIDEILPVSTIVSTLMDEYNMTKEFIKKGG